MPSKVVLTVTMVAVILIVLSMALDWIVIRMGGWGLSSDSGYSLYTNSPFNILFETRMKTMRAFNVLALVFFIMGMLAMFLKNYTTMSYALIVLANAALLVQIIVWLTISADMPEGYLAGITTSHSMGLGFFAAVAAWVFTLLSAVMYFHPSSRELLFAVAILVLVTVCTMLAFDGFKTAEVYSWPEDSTATAAAASVMKKVRENANGVAIGQILRRKERMGTEGKEPYFGALDWRAENGEPIEKDAELEGMGYDRDDMRKQSTGGVENKAAFKSRRFV
jgi:hypothetical protein